MVVNTVIAEVFRRTGSPSKQVGSGRPSRKPGIVNPADLETCDRSGRLVIVGCGVDRQRTGLYGGALGLVHRGVNEPILRRNDFSRFLAG